MDGDRQRLSRGRALHPAWTPTGFLERGKSLERHAGGVGRRGHLREANPSPGPTV